jgi:hypothetical protein
MPLLPVLQGSSQTAVRHLPHLDGRLPDAAGSAGAVLSSKVRQPQHRAQQQPCISCTRSLTHTATLKVCWPGCCCYLRVTAAT